MEKSPLWVVDPDGLAVDATGVLSDDQKRSLDGVLPFPSALARAGGSFEGHHIEVHLSDTDARAARALADLRALAACSPARLDPFLRLAVSADLLLDRLADDAIQSVAVSIGARLSSTVQSSAGAFEVEDPRSTFVIAVERDGNRVATCTAWVDGLGASEGSAGGTAMTVSCASAATCLETARAALAAPANARAILDEAHADGWLVRPDGHIVGAI